MTLSINNIRPDYDPKECCDILTFTVDGENRSEFLEGSSLGRERYRCGEMITEYLLDEGIRDEIHAVLESWLEGLKEDPYVTGFFTKANDPDIEGYHHTLNISEGINIEVKASAIKRLNLDSPVIEILTRNGCATILWSDRDFGDQEMEFAPGGDEDARILAYTLSTPGTVLEDIESRLARLREEVEDAPEAA